LTSAWRTTFQRWHVPANSTAGKPAVAPGGDQKSEVLSPALQPASAGLRPLGPGFSRGEARDEHSDSLSAGFSRLAPRGLEPCAIPNHATVDLGANTC